MDYIPNTESEKKEMLEEIGVDNILNLFIGGKWPELLVQEYIHGGTGYGSGIEYTVDCWRGDIGTCYVPRIRQKIRSGITFDTCIDMRQDIIDYSSKLANHLNLKYCFGFQFIIGKKGIPYLIECNPRVQGTMV
ncbi:MAG: ATP-grasp domain-containing protein, partial [Nanoarchaeota archaeon]|nr:ATP-grasp domain-containing protein [Nanoarchaeota archaeon]